MERMAEKEEGEREVAPEVAAARAERQAEPLAEEDLGDEAAADEAEDEDEDEEDDGDGGPRTTRRRAADGDEPWRQTRALVERCSSGRRRSSPAASTRRCAPSRRWAARRCSSSAASGAYVYDVDGNRYIDFVGSWGPLILGHADPDVLAAIVHAAAVGTTFGAPTAREVEFGELVRFMVPSMEKMRLGLLGHRGDDVGAARGARLHRTAPHHQDRRRLPRPRRHAAGQGRLGRGHAGAARLGRRHRRRPSPTRSSSPATTSTPCAPRSRRTATRSPR